MDGLLAAGALDVFYTPVQMKKSRPGTLITIVAPPDRRPRSRICCSGIDDDRRPLRGDVADVPGPRRRDRDDAVRRRPLQDRPPGRRELNASPEFDDCVRLAAQHGVSIKAVQAAASRKPAAPLAP
jgi:hypothetical protein